ncbi:MAG: YafY family transcriptional regulator [Clostridia bacterium]|nr:YafY family transcriptional regulator [Clostridia bacterium]
MKINRLLEIVIILLNKKMVTAKELSERFDVSTRTIYRDIDILSSSGIPIYTNKGNGGGIALLENFTMNKTLLSEKDSESIILALKTLQATKYPEIELVLDKLGGLFGNVRAEDWVTVDFSRWGEDSLIESKFNNIKKAILERKIICFDYVNSFNHKSSRKAAPIKLYFKGESWYVWAYCIEKQGIRLFKLSRMKHLKMTDDSFNRNEKVKELEKIKQKQQAPPMVKLKLEFQPSVLYRLYDYYDDDMIQQNKDDTYTLNVEFPEDEWIYSYIMSFGSLVKVLEPEYVRDEVIKRFSKTLEQYNGVENR